MSLTSHYPVSRYEPSPLPDLASEATRAYLARADRAHQHPRFWAPFVVMGCGDTLPPRP